MNLTNNRSFHVTPNRNKQQHSSSEHDNSTNLTFTRPPVVTPIGTRSPIREDRVIHQSPFRPPSPGRNFSSFDSDAFYDHAVSQLSPRSPVPNSRGVSPTRETRERVRAVSPARPLPARAVSPKPARLNVSHNGNSRAPGTPGRTDASTLKAIRRIKQYREKKHDSVSRFIHNY